MAAMLASVGIAACGSGGGGADGAGSVWTIGGIGNCSGTFASGLGGTCKAMEAWAQSVNDAGGINGHKIKMIMKDDGSNATTSNTMVRELVEKDHVIAIVGDSSNFSGTWASYVDSRGIPVIGGLPIVSPFVTDSNFFNIGTNLVAGNYATMQQVRDHGFDKFGFLYCAEAPACAQAVPLAQAAGKLTGVSVQSDKVAANAPDFTAQCLEMKNSGVQAFEVGAPPETTIRVLDACRAQGVQARLFADDGTITPNWVDDKNTEGMFGFELVAPWFYTQLPAIQQYHDAMKKYAPEVYNSPRFGANTTYMWDAGKLFEAAAKAGNLGANAKPVDVKRGLYALKGETLNGLTAPLTFTAGKPSVNSCYFPIEIRNSEFVAPNGATPTCIPEDKVGPLLNSLGG
ncbi:ABC transporter substrate-binding protein [Nocardia sp. CA2R105]|uniref:ABC transporter substrate-binding protein n=1 Tax=Nocardia coffeae TaxID=2873381 RepID=UPI001CA67C10|nr:ABC transporter substrate-binding protein [Nocardia coffeae]MBY8862949.1 ABC transporter substrate-binding protein [Nocardia coffeae]